MFLLGFVCKALMENMEIVAPLTWVYYELYDPS